MLRPFDEAVRFNFSRQVQMVNTPVTQHQVQVFSAQESVARYSSSLVAPADSAAEVRTDVLTVLELRGDLGQAGPVLRIGRMRVCAQDLRLMYTSRLRFDQAVAPIAVDDEKFTRIFCRQILIELRFVRQVDRKSTRLNSSHLGISYAVF